MHKRIIGQDEAVAAVADAMRRVRSGFENKERPISVFLFLGPTGVGKTETAKVLAGEYFGDESSMIRIDMNELQTNTSVERIIGSPSGASYISNALVDEVAEKPFSLILLDEFEKANHNILNIFLQIFDEGKVSDANGRTVSFNNTIIIATSNAGSELIRENQNLSKDTLVDTLLQNNIFSPELINRFDDVIMFKQLTKEEIHEVSKLLLKESGYKLSDNQIEVEFDDSVIKKVVEGGYSSEFGARNIRRYIEENVEEFISKLILWDKIKKGEKITLSIDESGEFVVR